MGGLVSGIFDLIGGDPARDQEEQLGTLGKTQTSTGTSLVTPAATYYENLLSGDPAKIAQSLAPEISAGQGQVEQQALQGANFGARSGGTAAATRAAADANRGNVINLVGGLQERAANEAGALGTNQENMGAGNVHDVAGMKTARRNQVLGDVGGIANSAASIAMPFLGAAGAGGMDPGIFHSLMNSGTVHPGALDTSSLDPTELGANDLFKVT